MVHSIRIKDEDKEKYGLEKDEQYYFYKTDEVSDSDETFRCFYCFEDLADKWCFLVTWHDKVSRAGLLCLKHLCQVYDAQLFKDYAEYIAQENIFNNHHFEYNGGI